MKKKRILSTLIVLCMALSLMSSVAFAAESSESEGRTARYTAIQRISAILTIDRWGKAGCVATVILDDGYTADETMELQQDYVNRWLTIKSWSDSGGPIVEMLETYYVESGYDYQVVVTVDVYDSNGRFVESDSAVSETLSY